MVLGKLIASWVVLQTIFCSTSQGLA